MTLGFDVIDGNDRIKTYLSKIIKSGNVPQSLLFAGPEGAGKDLFAETFARLLVRAQGASHPDIRHYSPEGKIGMHSIQSMREFSEAVYLTPFQALKKVFIIHEADRMLAASANALLKTFEEPALDSVIILITDAPERLLPTILSRCQTVRFQPFPKKNPAVKFDSSQNPSRALLLDALAEGHLKSYPRLVSLSKAVSDQIENSLKEQESALRGRLAEAFLGEPSAQQKEMIEKEVEGILALKKSVEFKMICNLLLSWWRDIQLIAVSGSPQLLMNSDYEVQLRKAVQNQTMASIDKIEQAVSESILSLERSTSLTICLENLFLKLY